MAAEDDRHDQHVSDEEVAEQNGEELPERAALSLLSPAPHGWVTLPVVPPEVM
jgi:hypothetical protein